MYFSKSSESSKNFSSNTLVFYNDEFQQDVDLTISIGVLEKLVDTIDLETILLYLDHAMYDSKKEKKECWKP